MIIRRVLTGIAVGVAVTVASACGSDSTAPEPSIPEVTDLGQGIDSGVQGVPIPADAEKRDDLEGGWTVPDATFDDVVSWYETQLPIGAGHEGLAFCETQEDDGFMSWLWWDDGDQFSGDEPRPWLAVRVIEDEPTEVLISYDPEDVSGPCH